jgi:hypothetical protein
MSYQESLPRLIKFAETTRGGFVDEFCAASAKSGASNVTCSRGMMSECVSCKFKTRLTGLSTDSIPVDRLVTGLAI